MGATVAYAIIAGFQLAAIKGQLREMQATTLIAQESSDTADKSVLLAQKTERDSRKSTEDQARQSAKALDSSIDTFQQEQRAWVGPVQASPPPYVDGGRPVYIKAGEPPLFWVMLSNSGKTPARTFTSIIETHIYGSNEKFRPVYRSSGKTGTVGVLFPGVPMEIDTLRSTGGMDAAHISLLTSGKNIYYVYGKIGYTDVFGKHHTTKFCNYVRQDLSSLVMCNSYNEAN
jgi:hypothetical protein